MSNIFGDINNGNIKMPDAKFNSNGPLPPTSNPDVHFTGAKINATSALLKGVDAYDYGDHKYTSDDIAYQNIPVKIQKIIPQVKLPSSIDQSQEDWLTMSHPIDDGDLAFVLKLKHHKHEVMKNLQYFEKNNMGRAVDCIVNLSTINYLLRGLQTPFATNQTWHTFLSFFDSGLNKKMFEADDVMIRQTACDIFVRDCIAPLGVVIGSEKQGGQHENTNRAVDWPVNFVATICIDGFNENMVNIWRRCQLGAGDQLMLALSRPRATTCKIGPTMLTSDTSWVCNLNHYYKSRTSQKFQKLSGDVYQLVPTTNRECDKGAMLREKHLLPINNQQANMLGMWHIATSQIMSNMVGTSSSRVNFCQTSGMTSYMDDMQNLSSGALLQSTVCPVWEPALHSQTTKKIFDMAVKSYLQTTNPTNAARRQQVKTLHRTHHVTYFGSQMAAAPLNSFSAVHDIVKKKLGPKGCSQKAYDDAILLASTFMCDPSFVACNESGLVHFTTEAHEYLRPTNATTNTNNTVNTAAVIHKPVIPLFQQIATKPKISATAVDVPAAPGTAVPTPPGTALTPRKRKPPTTATALNTQSSSTSDADDVSMNVNDSMSL
jgi:hypothetical protein